MKFLVGRHLTRRPPGRMVVHEISDLIMVHGDCTRGDGRTFMGGASIDEILGLRDRRAAPSIVGSRSNVVHSQAG